MRAPARTSRSVAVITIALLLHGWSLLVVGEHRWSAFCARGNRFFEVGGEQSDEKLSQAFGLHMSFQTTGVQPSPQCALGQLDARPRERGDARGDRVAGVEQL